MNAKLKTSEGGNMISKHPIVKETKAKKSVLTGLIVVFLSGIGLGDAIAQTHWAMDGAGCVPTNLAIQNDSYIITAGKIKFKDPKVGSITVICPVSVKVGSINSLGVSYRDSTGLGTSAKVQASLRRINKVNGSVGTVTGLVFDSNNEWETNYTFLYIAHA